MLTKDSSKVGSREVCYPGFESNTKLKFDDLRITPKKNTGTPDGECRFYEFYQNFSTNEPHVTIKENSLPSNDEISEYFKRKLNINLPEAGAEVTFDP